MLLNYVLVGLLIFLATLMLFSAKEEAPQPPKGRLSNGQKKIFHIFVLQSSKKERFLCQKDTVLQI